MVVKDVKIVSDAGAPSVICVLPQGNRYYRLYNDIEISVVTDEGTFKFFFKAMFMTNFRSGGVLIDKIIDQIGDLLQQVAYLCHDAAYTPCASLGMEHPLSRKLADGLLRAILVYAGVGKFKAWLVYSSVRLFGGPAYNDDDDLTESNSRLFTFRWEK